MATAAPRAGRALVFPSEHALIAALGSGLVPADVAAQPARFARRDDGAIEVCPDAKLAPAIVTALGKAGVEVAAAGAGLTQAPCWPAVIAVRRARDSDAAADRVALFWVEREQALIELLGELIRLGCDRAAFQLFEREADPRRQPGAADSSGATIEREADPRRQPGAADSSGATIEREADPRRQPGAADSSGATIHSEPGALVRAYAPPYYTVSAAGEAGERRVFVPSPPDQDRVWVEAGFEHPLAAGSQVADGSIALIGSDGTWHILSDTGWRDALSIAEIQIPGPVRPHSPDPPASRLAIPLSLSRATREQLPSLWLCGERGEEVVERLIASVPDDVIGRLLYAVAVRDGVRQVILRARSGRGGPPAIEFDPGMTRELAPMAGVSNLYLPLGTGIEPPLRRDLLRDLLAAEVERVYWLVPGEHGGFSVDSIAESAFAPLADWVDYVVHSAAGQLEPWVRSSVFEFAAFRSIGTEWAAAPAVASAEPEPDRGPARRRSSRARARSAPNTDADPPVSLPAPTAPAALELAPAIAAAIPTPPSEARTRLAAVERAFLDLDDPPDSLHRASMWAEMASLHHTLAQPRDAALCWTRALWEVPPEVAVRLSSAWAIAESATGPRDAGFARDRAPTRDEMSRLVARCVAASAAGEAMPRDVPVGAAVRWLDQWDELLDVRSVWLVRTALARAAGSDSLAMARARDRVLARLRNGLSIERDIPTFLRFLGGTGGDTVALDQLASELGALHDAYRSTRRRRSPMEAPEERTGALVDLEIAYGFAALGRSERARTLRDKAIASLPGGDPVYSFLSRAYAARIDQALEGKRRETALPPELTAALGELPKVDRFRIDRLRQASTILEPHERLNPFAGFHRSGDPHGEELAPLRGMADAGELARQIARLLSVALAADTAVDDRARLVDGVMDFLPRLAEADAVPALRAIADGIGDVPAGRRALLLEEALMLAGFFDRDDLGRDIATRLGDLVGELSAEEAAELATEFGRCLRSLRRVGLADRATSLLARLSAATTGSGPRAVEARLHLAAGVAYLGGFAEAEPAFRAAQAGLADAQVSPSDRLRIARAVASAWSHAPRDAAIAGLRDLARVLPMISDSYTTNSHFCLSVVSFMDGLVLGLVTGDLAMGELGRRFLDQDEYLIRRRIHRELGATT